MQSYPIQTGGERRCANDVSISCRKNIRESTESSSKFLGSVNFNYVDFSDQIYVYIFYNYIVAYFWPKVVTMLRKFIADTFAYHVPGMTA